MTMTTTAMRVVTVVNEEMGAAADVMVGQVTRVTAAVVVAEVAEAAEAVRKAARAAGKALAAAPLFVSTVVCAQSLLQRANGRC